MVPSIISFLEKVQECRLRSLHTYVCSRIHGRHSFGGLLFVLWTHLEASMRRLREEWQCCSATLLLRHCAYTVRFELKRGFLQGQHTSTEAVAPDPGLEPGIERAVELPSRKGGRTLLPALRTLTRPEHSHVPGHRHKQNMEQSKVFKYLTRPSHSHSDGNPPIR